MQTRAKIVIVVVLVLAAFFLYGLWKKQSTASSQDEVIEIQAGKGARDLSTWKEFRAINGKFKTLLPSIPQHVAEAVPLPSGKGLVRYDMYLAQEKGGDTVMISMVQYPKEFDSALGDDILDGVMKEMMSGNENNQLKNMVKGKYQEYPSLDFAIENNKVFIRSRAFIVGKTLYVINLISRNGEDLDSVFEKFINSFSVGENVENAQ